MTRPKRNIARDFSDGVLAAEIVGYYFPNLVEIHNYYSTNSVTKKKYNWQFLNKRVLKKLDCALTDQEVEEIIGGRPQAVERFLLVLRYAVRNITSGQKQLENSSPKLKSVSKKGPVVEHK